MSFNKQEVIQCFVNTLDNDSNTRQLAEQSLLNNLSQPNFLNFLLSLSVDDEIDGFIRLSSVLFVKNSIVRYWLKRNQQVTKVLGNISINENDKVSVKSNLIQVLSQSITKLDEQNNKQGGVIVTHLTSIITNFLESSENDNNMFGHELLMVVEELINTSKASDNIINSSHLMSALLITFELSKYYRWSIQGFNTSTTSNINIADQVNDSIVLLNKLTQFMSPILLNLSMTILGNVTSADMLDPSLNRQFHLLYLALKIFKFTMFNDLPDYLLSIENNKFIHMDNWIGIQLNIAKLGFPINYKFNCGNQKDYRMKSQKWAMANLTRIFLKYGQGDKFDVNRYNINVEQHSASLKNFQVYYQQEFLGQYFETFFSLIDQWHSKKLLIFDDSLYYLVRFFSFTLNDEKIFQSYLSSNLKSLIQYLIFPSIILNQENLSLFYEDDEEFFRKIYNSPYDTHRPDTASINFMYKLTNTYFDSVIGWLFEFLHEIFVKRKSYREGIEDTNSVPESIQQDLSGNNNDFKACKLQNALEAEAALRLMGIISHHLVNKETSPIKSQIDELINSYITPEILNHEYLFLTARALDALASFNYSFTDLTALSEAFKGVMQLLGDDINEESYSVSSDITDCFLIQVEALDALKSLLVNADITNYLRSSVNKIVSKLLQLISEYEVDFLTTILDEFITTFSAELKPFSNELSIKLSQQFLKISSELMEVYALKANSNEDNMDKVVALTNAEGDKESQCIGVINNISVMIETMSTEKLLLIHFVMNFDPCVQFVVHNSMIALIDEIISLSTLLLRSISRVTRSIQNNFDYILDNFNNFGWNDFYDYFNNFFESYVMINYNYKIAWENQFNNKIQQEVSSNDNSNLSLDEVEKELKNVLDIDYFTLDSDNRILTLIKLNTQVQNDAIMESNYRNINFTLALFEDIILSVNNASLFKVSNANVLDYYLSIDNVNDSNMQENQIIQSILEDCLNCFLNVLYVNLEEIVLLTEEDADLSYIDFDIIYLINNFLKLLFILILYKPILTIQIVNNFGKISNLLDILNKIDDTNSLQADELPYDMVNDSNPQLSFFQLLNKLWLTMNGNNSFVKMKKSSKFSVKLQILTILKFVKNQDSLKESLQLNKNENCNKWFDIWIQKAYVKLIEVVSEIPKLYEAEQKTKAALQSENSKGSNSANATGADDEDDEEDDAAFFADFLDEEEILTVDNHNFNESIRLQLLNHKNFANVGDGQKINVLQEFNHIMQSLESSGNPAFTLISSYINQKNLGELVSKAIEIDNNGLLVDF
ncbi:Sxm1 protein [Saccharomycopsis crataegensis]|uniref:Sxm1 protein n=1 Tax=Saccharomycopsis crataegensis TaxID=43959 RepID=A0AAV5QNX0_9ASCO|nr:Sxm1 protein [Saccharomycopsis crataegensis]